MQAELPVKLKANRVLNVKQSVVLRKNQHNAKKWGYRTCYL